MNSAWSIKKLGEVCHSDLGKTLNQSKDTGNLYPYLCAVNIQWDKIDLSTLKKTRFEEHETERYSVKKGDLLVCEGGDIGRAAIWDIETPIRYQNALHRIRFNESMLPRFCLYFLRFLKNKGILDSQYGKGVTIKHLVKSSLLSIPVPVPTINDQRRIVDELDLLTGIIGDKECQLRDLDSLAQSIFYEMFGDPVSNEKGWPVKAIKESVEEMFLGPFGSSLKTDSYVPKEQSYCMVYEQKHAIKKTLKQDNHYINKDKFNLLKRFSVAPGDFIMSCRGTIGEIFELPKDAPNGIIHPSLMKIRLKEGVYSHEFFKVVLKQVVEKQEMNGGVVKMAVTAKKLGQIQIVAPPMDAQIEFNRKIEKIEEQKELIKQSISDMQTLLDKRMSDYFN